MSAAPGWPGMEPRWTSSAKSGVGTALDGRSRVWFTISHGIVDEVYFDRVDQANTRDLGLIVTDGGAGGGFFSEEKRDTASVVHLLAPGVPGYRLVNTCRQGRYQIVKSVVADPERSVLLQHVAFEAKEGMLEDYRLFALLAPHLRNQGYGNDGWVADYKGIPMLFAERAGVCLALACAPGWRAGSVGYVGASDGWQQLRARGRLVDTHAEARDGNIALTGEVDLSAPAGRTGSRRAEVVIALAFGRTAAEAGQNARMTLVSPFAAVARRYVDGWRRFHAEGVGPEQAEAVALMPEASRRATVRVLAEQGVARSSDAPAEWPDEPAGELPSRVLDLFRMSTALIATHEDKRAQGGIIASLSIPWGQARGDHEMGGYHLVWPRDLVEAAAGLLAGGHSGRAQRTLRYLLSTQEADGHWPQNMWLDGTAYWQGVQMDETAFPILFADLLRRERQLSGLDPWPMVRRAAAFVLRNGPITEQDRWEEDGGFSPFTLAVEVAALLAAADFAELADEPATAAYLRETADAWNEGIERWTFVRDSELSRRLGIEGYYARIAPPDVATAATPAVGWVPIKNRAPEQSRVRVDALISPDALALVRFGLRSAHDPRIVDTVRAIDATVRSQTATGPVWHRYNGDGYGEKEDGRPFDGIGVGRGWPLLAGERGHYELAAGRPTAALQLLEVMRAQASDGGLLPEQVWDAPDLPARELFNGRQTGSAMPLVWAHAEYVKLVRSLLDGRVWDMPPQPYERYVRRGQAAEYAVWGCGLRIGALPAGRRLRIQAARPNTVHWSLDGWRTTHDTPARDTGLELWAADLPTADLAVGDVARFTLHWTAEDRWEGRDYAVTVVAPSSTPVAAPTPHAAPAYESTRRCENA